MKLIKTSLTSLILSIFYFQAPATAKEYLLIEEAQFFGSYYASTKVADQKIQARDENSGDQYEPNIRQSITFYDLDGNPSAYMYKIEENGSFSGYVTISADKDFFPLLEKATGDVQFPPDNLDSCYEIAESITERPLNLNSYKFIYLGAQDYIVKFPVDGTNAIFISLVSKMVISQESMVFRAKLRNEKAKQIQHLVKDSKIYGTLSNIPIQLAGKTIYDVKAYTWYRGCGTTALSMILSYWGEHGYPTLNYSASTFTWEGPASFWFWDYCTPREPYIPRTLADMLANHMGISAVCDGNQNDFNSTSNEQATAVAYITGQDDYLFAVLIDESCSFDKYRDEIDRNHPIKIGYLVDGDPQKGHAVTGIGYGNFTDYHVLRYYNTWDTGDHIMTAENETLTNWIIIYPDENRCSETIACYPFNGNAHDYSGNGNHGIVNGASLTTDFLGNPNSAYAFEDSDDYIEVPHSPLHNLSQLSLVTWVYPYCSHEGVISKGKYDENAPYALYINSIFWQGYETGGCTPAINFALNNGSIVVSSGFTQDLSSPAAWHQVAATYDGAKVKLYVDGKKQQEEAFTENLNISKESLYIGGPYLGRLDDVRIYDRALSEEEIKELYNAPFSPLPRPAKSLPAILPLLLGGN